jgi:hypothetical protein
MHLTDVVCHTVLLQVEFAVSENIPKCHAFVLTLKHFIIDLVLDLSRVSEQLLA